MDDKIKAAFGAVYADEELKSKTRSFIAQKSHGYTARRALNYRSILPAAAVACFALILFARFMLYFTPTARICIDINPSLELGINRFNKVVSVEPLNDDGKKLAESLDIKFVGYDEALQKILENKSIEAMLSDNEVMTVTVVETNTPQSVDILSEVRACVKDYDNVYCHSASSEEVSAAHELELPCGKYRVFLELQALDPDITAEEVRDMTMRQIRELIAELSGNGDNESSVTVSGNGQNGENEGSATVDGNGHHGNGHEHDHTG